MSEKIAYIAGTFDTKSVELLFVRDAIEKQGLKTKVVDLGTSANNQYPDADVTASEVATYYPNGIDEVFTGDRGSSVAAMSEAFRLFLTSQDDIAGVIGFGGSGGTALISPAFQALPLGLPKVIVSTMASGNIAPYVGTSDTAMFYSVTDISGLNPILEQVLSNATHALCGMIEHYYIPEQSSVPVIGMTMFGVTTTCVQNIQKKLEPANKCLVFHATGTGGKTLEKLVENGLLSGVIDITTTEIADHLMGGILSAGKERMDAMVDAKIPYVASCGALDMVNFGAKSSISEKYKGRLFYEHNPQITLMRTSKDENDLMGQWIGAKLNKFQSPVVFLIPLTGFSALDAEGQPFHDPIADEAFIGALEKTVKNDHVNIIKLPCHINDQEFSAAITEHYQALIR